MKHTKAKITIFFLAALFAVTACGCASSGGGSDSETSSSETSSSNTTSSDGETSSGETFSGIVTPSDSVTDSESATPSDSETSSGETSSGETSSDENSSGVTLPFVPMNDEATGEAKKGMAPMKKAPTEQTVTETSGTDARTEVYAEDVETIPAGGTVADNELFTCVTEDGLSLLSLDAEVSAGKNVSYGWRQNTATEKGVDSDEITVTAKEEIALTVYLVYADADYSNDYSNGEYRYVVAGETNSVPMGETRSEAVEISVPRLCVGETLSVRAYYETNRDGYLWLFGIVASELS